VDIDAGAHTLTVEVSGSETEQPESIDVPFSVSGAGSSSIYLGILLGLLALAFVVTRRRMRPGLRDPGAQATPVTSRKE
jgi:MYXO-CTERM domain-containing protein